MLRNRSECHTGGGRILLAADAHAPGFKDRVAVLVVSVSDVPTAPFVVRHHVRWLLEDGRRLCLFLGLFQRYVDAANPEIPETEVQT